MAGKLSSIFPTRHFRAIFWRRWILIKRSAKQIISSMVGTIVFSAIAIIMQWLMRTMMVQSKKNLTWERYEKNTNGIAIIKPQANLDDDQREDLEKVKEVFNATYMKDRGTNDLVINEFDSVEEFNKAVFDNAEKLDRQNYAFGILLDRNPNGVLSEDMPIPMMTYDLTMLYNSSATIFSPVDKKILFGYSQINRMLWKLNFGEDSDIMFTMQKLLRRLSERVFGSLGPMLIACGLLSITPLLISQPITDITGEVRQYMQSCTLKVLPYWVATFCMDLILWVIIVTIVWLLFLASVIPAFLDNVFASWYVLVMVGPSYILFMYCMSFAFRSPESAARQAFLIGVVILLIPTIIMIVRAETNPLWLEWIYAIFPQVNLQQVLGYILTNMGVIKQSFDYYWKWENSRAYLVMMFVDIFIYAAILALIEMTRNAVARMSAKRSFGGYQNYFQQVKSKHPVTDEVHAMEETVHASHDFAVRIENVSRLFLNTAGKPIPAVNNVTLGVQEGSLFGFLGANGAGKTTLIRMITGMLPPSDGTIEIFGTKIEELDDVTVLSICPQFNNHLCDEMTPREHFEMYAMIFQMTDDQAKEATEKLIKTLDLDELADKPLRELSGGDVRKLAIAMTFISPSRIVLLDEPTASLDPVARRHVHEMIQEYKDVKTFMLCTHLLSEAESLCDQISIMIKGCVYTVGSPQYLTQKFGTEFKIDVGLIDESEENGAKCDQFFASKLPTAILSIKRPKARIYSIPATDITLPELFEIMQEGEVPENGYCYYTCSSSSLERVFMEIVRMSESDEGEFAHAENKPEAAEEKNEEKKGRSVESRVSEVHELEDLDEESGSVDEP